MVDLTVEEKQVIVDALNESRDFFLQKYNEIEIMLQSEVLGGMQSQRFLQSQAYMDSLKRKNFDNIKTEKEALKEMDELVEENKNLVEIAGLISSRIQRIERERHEGGGGEQLQHPKGGGGAAVSRKLRSYEKLDFLGDLDKLTAWMEFIGPNLKGSDDTIDSAYNKFLLVIEEIEKKHIEYADVYRGYGDISQRKVMQLEDVRELRVGVQKAMELLHQMKGKGTLLKLTKLRLLYAKFTETSDMIERSHQEPAQGAAVAPSLDAAAGGATPAVGLLSRDKLLTRDRVQAQAMKGRRLPSKKGRAEPVVVRDAAKQADAPAGAAAPTRKIAKGFGISPGALGGSAMFKRMQEKREKEEEKRKDAKETSEKKPGM